MKTILLLAALFTALTGTNTDASTVGPELLADPDFDDPSSWDVGSGSSVVENGHLVVINHTGLIFPDPQLETFIGTTYQYSLSVAFVNNLSGGGKVTIGGQTIWEPGYNTGIFTGSLLASDTTGLVFNFLTPYVGRAEFDSISIKALIETPLPAALWLFCTGLLSLAGMARMKATG